MYVELRSGTDESLIGTVTLDSDDMAVVAPGPGESQASAQDVLDYLPIEHKGEDFLRLLPRYFNGQGIRGFLFND
jgi:hypothetical protein